MTADHRGGLQKLRDDLAETIQVSWEARTNAQDKRDQLMAERELMLQGLTDPKEERTTLKIGDKMVAIDTTKEVDEGRPYPTDRSAAKEIRDKAIQQTDPALAMKERSDDIAAATDAKAMADIREFYKQSLAVVYRRQWDMLEEMTAVEAAINALRNQIATSRLMDAEVKKELETELAEAEIVSYELQKEWDEIGPQVKKHNPNDSQRFPEGSMRHGFEKNWEIWWKGFIEVEMTKHRLEFKKWHEDGRPDMPDSDNPIIARELNGMDHEWMVLTTNSINKAAKNLNEGQREIIKELEDEGLESFAAFMIRNGPDPDDDPPPSPPGAANPVLSVIEGGKGEEGLYESGMMDVNWPERPSQAPDNDPEITDTTPVGTPESWLIESLRNGARTNPALDEQRITPQTEPPPVEEGANADLYDLKAEDDYFVTVTDEFDNPRLNDKQEPIRENLGDYLRKTDKEIEKFKKYMRCIKGGK